MVISRPLAPGLLPKERARESSVVKVARLLAVRRDGSVSRHPASLLGTRGLLVLIRGNAVARLCFLLSCCCYSGRCCFLGPSRSAGR